MTYDFMIITTGVKIRLDKVRVVLIRRNDAETRVVGSR